MPAFERMTTPMREKPWQNGLLQNESSSTFCPMRILTVGIIILLTLSGFTLSAEHDAAQIRRILNGYRKLYDGYRASEVLRSVVIRGEQTQGEQQFDFLLRKKQPDSMRYSLSNGERIPLYWATMVMRAGSESRPVAG